MISKISNICLSNQSFSTQTNYNNKNKQEPSFTGLTNRMGKKIYNGFYNMSELFPREKTKNPICGKLPAFMKNRIKLVTNDYESATKEIFDTFTAVCDELREFEPSVTSTLAEIKNKRQNSTVEKLKNVLQKYKIISKWDDFDLIYLDKGGKGSVWKLEGLKYTDKTNEDEFVIKVFHTKSIQTNAYHGCYPEINSAMYWMKTLGYDTNRGKFYWGDVNNAYMINKFIDEDVRLPKRFPKPEDYGVKFTDEDSIHMHNVCKKYSYDWGGGVVINQVINSNRFARELMHFIQNSEEKYRLIEWQKRYHWKPNGNYDSKFAGLSLGIKYIKPENRIACFRQCFEKRGKYNDRAMAYTLKYLPHDYALKYYKLLASDAKDNVLKKILRNEIPLLSIKDQYAHRVKDDLIVFNNVQSKFVVDEYIDNEKLNQYYKLAKQYKII